jgi:hypothetical protein
METQTGVNEMSERKWTPGPWFVGKDLSIGPNGQGVSVIVAACDYDHADANAHLIAAAPDLYEALEDAALALEAAGLSCHRQFTALAKALVK